jgi:hypothetical protein
MHTVFANHLQLAALSVTARASRKRRASEALAMPPPADTVEDDQRDACPYEHARNQVPTTNTVPVFEHLPGAPAPEPSEPKHNDPKGKDPCFFTIQSPDTFQHCIRTPNLAKAKLALQPVAVSRRNTQLLAVPDSGASHILVRSSDAHILHNVEFTQPNQQPYAALKAANNTELVAIGRGMLRLAGLQPTAYIFNDNDLAANLLGLAPFCDLGCTAVFKKHTFHLFRPNQVTPIMTGRRKQGVSLCTVEIPKPFGSDHIPPPAPHYRNGVYIEANYASKLDAASYVKFVHAALGFPAPTTFLNAVSRGYINGPNQFERLTTKMVRKHMLNSLATARDHLDKTPAKLPHANSEAVSALQRYRKRNARNTAKIHQMKVSKIPAFDYG